MQVIRCSQLDIQIGDEILFFMKSNQGVLPLAFTESISSTVIQEEEDNLLAFLNLATAVAARF